MRYCRIVGESAVMRRLLRMVERIGPKDITVLLRGETGTGKELVASLVHAQSTRSSVPLVTFQIARQFPASSPRRSSSDMREEHSRAPWRRGAASSRKASGGTLVLDEVGELPAAVQAKLLRALQEGEIQPVGAPTVERVDVRVIACTNRKPAEEASAGRFREDLYYRLAVVELVVPPLRHRTEEIPALAAEFARRYGERFGNEHVRLSPALIELSAKSPWPGNVRELENAVRRMVALRLRDPKSAWRRSPPREGRRRPLQPRSLRRKARSRCASRSRRSSAASSRARWRRPAGTSRGCATVGPGPRDAHGSAEEVRPGRTERKRPQESRRPHLSEHGEEETVGTTEARAHAGGWRRRWH